MASRAATPGRPQTDRVRSSRKMASAAGSVQIPASRDLVWQALAVLGPYCPVCDVSYRAPDGDDAVRMGPGTRFVCIPGHDVAGLIGDASARWGEVIEWDPPRRVVTRLELTPETWTTRIDLEGGGAGPTRVTVTLTYRARGGTWLRDRLHRRAVQGMVDASLGSTLAKIPDHVQLLFDTRD